VLVISLNFSSLNKGGEGYESIYWKTPTFPLKVKMGFQFTLGLQSGLILDRFHLGVIYFDFDFDLGFDLRVAWA